MMDKEFGDPSWLNLKTGCYPSDSEEVYEEGSGNSSSDSRKKTRCKVESVSIDSEEDGTRENKRRKSSNRSLEQRNRKRKRSSGPCSSVMARDDRVERIMTESESDSERRKIKRKKKEKGKAKIDVNGVSKPRLQVPNIRGIPDKAINLMRNLNERQRRWITEFKFDGLLGMNQMEMERNIGYWLMRRFDGVTGELDMRRTCVVVPEEVEGEGDVVDKVKITGNDVAYILGIPNTLRPVPDAKLTKGDKRRYKKYLKLLREESREIWQDDKKTAIHPTSVLSMMQAETCREEFMVYFLTYILGAFLCPTQGEYISPSALKTAMMIGDPCVYAWGDHILEHLKACRLKVEKKKQKGKCVVRSEEEESREAMLMSQVGAKVGFDKKGGFGGCLLVLVLFYLDRIQTSVKVAPWGGIGSVYMPCVTVWTEDLVRGAVKEDYNNVTGSYGVAPLYRPMAKYEEAHPKVGDGGWFSKMYGPTGTAIDYGRISQRRPRYLEKANIVNNPKGSVVYKAQLEEKKKKMEERKKAKAMESDKVRKKVDEKDEGVNQTDEADQMGTNYALCGGNQTNEADQIGTSYAPFADACTPNISLLKEHHALIQPLKHVDIINQSTRTSYTCNSPPRNEDHNRHCTLYTWI